MTHLLVYVCVHTHTVRNITTNEVQHGNSYRLDNYLSLPTNWLLESESVSWSIMLNEEVECLKKCCNVGDLKYTNSYRRLRTCNGQQEAT
jgi:hypothetical protein